MRALLLLHISAGTLGLLAGAAGLLLRKGSPAHVRAGRVFAAAMLAMSGASVPLAVARNEPDNAIVGALTLYLVASGWRALRASWRAFEAAAVAWLGLTAAAGVAWGLIAQARPDGHYGGVAAPDLFLLALIVGAFGVSDLRRALRGVDLHGQALRRHVGRMGLAMFIATLSLFFGQAQIFPQAVRATGVHLVPVFAVGLVVLYWLLRLRLLERGRTGGMHARGHPVLPAARLDVP